ncbi:di-trans,poly-cis-decaprenylcistransferase [Patescibacteria group bacterium]|nr:di-trans,poly-cis-decaprenylcistransferase [Patescibacteria group bacterium]
MKKEKSKTKGSDSKKEIIPEHIGFIVDGNRRWARQYFFPVNYGHQKGYERVKNVIEWCLKKGVKVLSFFIFSTENWKRSKKEVAHLMSLIKRLFQEDLQYLMDQEVKLSISGWIDDPQLEPEIKKIAIIAQEKTKNNKRGIVNLAFNYGGRSEIVHAFKGMLRDGIKASQVNEEIISQYLWTQGLPDPDLVVRTSEKRLSGFLLWQSAYAELCFLDKYWPSIKEKDIDRILTDYSQRKRRFGK